MSLAISACSVIAWHNTIDLSVLKQQSRPFHSFCMTVSDELRLGSFVMLETDGGEHSLA